MYQGTVCEAYGFNGLGLVGLGLSWLSECEKKGVEKGIRLATELLRLPDDVMGFEFKKHEETSGIFRHSEPRRMRALQTFCGRAATWPATTRLG